MRKRVLLPEGLKAIRSLKAERDPQFRGGTFGPRAQMSHAHLCNIEAGRKNASEEVIHRFAALLGVSVDAISYTVETAQEAVA